MSPALTERFFFPFQSYQCLNASKFSRDVWQSVYFEESVPNSHFWACKPALSH